MLYVWPCLSYMLHRNLALTVLYVVQSFEITSALAVAEALASQAPKQPVRTPPWMFADAMPKVVSRGIGAIGLPLRKSRKGTATFDCAPSTLGGC